jgi:sugar phosphate isomerase/epimerase
VLLVVGDGLEVMDTLYPFFRLGEACRVVAAGPQRRRYHLVIHELGDGWDITQERAGYHLEAEVASNKVRSEDYAALVLPGGPRHRPNHETDDPGEDARAGSGARPPTGHGCARAAGPVFLPRKRPDPIAHGVCPAADGGPSVGLLVLVEQCGLARGDCTRIGGVEHRTKHLAWKLHEVKGSTTFAQTDLPTSCLAFAWRLAGPAKTVATNSFRDLTRFIRRESSRRSLRWEVPAGHWLVGLFSVPPGGICDKGEGPEVEQGDYCVPDGIWTGRTIGRPVISCEAFAHLHLKMGVMRRPHGEWESNAAAMRSAATYLFGQGVNRIQIHSFSYSPPGLPLPGWRLCAEIHLNRNLPWWWPFIRPLDPWVARLQWLLQAGRPIADALVYPVKSNPDDGPFRAMRDRQPVSAAKAVDAANEHTLPGGGTLSPTHSSQTSTMKTTRRRFLRLVTGTLAAPTLIAVAPRSKRLPIAFSTLGCPRWDWPTILRRASEWGYAAIELRGIQGEMDLTRRAEFSATQSGTTLRELDAAGLRLAGLGSSARLHDADAATRAAQLDEGRRFIDLAHRLKAPYVRVFGDKVVAGQPKQATIERVISGLRELGQHAKGSRVTVLLESHGDFCDSPTLLEVLKGADLRTVGLLWDTHHTFVAGKESPGHTLEAMGRYVRHVHLKDSRPEGNGVRYVLTGSGTVPLRGIVRLLVQRKYRGYFSFEWEKGWHPALEEPEIAFPQFAEAIRGYLAEAGFKDAS